MVPVFASKLPVLRKWNTPIDFGTSFRGHRLFGTNKTWRGLLCGTIAGTLLGLLMYEPLFSNDFGLGTFVAISAAMSAGALVGDAVESFFKRQRNIASGKAWFPFDQTDYIAGGLLFILPFGVLSLWLTLWIFGIFFGLHLLSSYIGYLIGFKDSPI